MTQSNQQSLRARLTQPTLWVTVLLATLAGCKKTETTYEGPRLYNVGVITIETRDSVVDVIEQPGVAIPTRVATITAEVAGRVESIPVRKGQMVYAGNEPTVLVTLNTDLLQAECDRCEADVTIAKLRYERVEDLFTRGGATEHERDQALANFQTAKAMLNASLAKLDRSVIVAPITGTIDMLPVEEGEYVQPGAEIVQIVDNHNMKVIVECSERDVTFLSLGELTKIVARYRGQDTEFDGRITFISQLLDPTTFTSRVEITVDNTEGKLRPGLVDVILTRQSFTDVIMVPLEVVIPFGDGEYVVYVIDKSPLLTLDIPAKDAEGLQGGDTINVTLPGSPDTTTTLTEVKTSPHGKEFKRVRFDGNAPLDSLEPGALATVTLPGGKPMSLILTPLPDDTGDKVGERLFTSPQTERRHVKLGLMYSTETQITEGLNPGDQLIVSGHQYVGPGQPVRITEPVPDNSPEQPGGGQPDPRNEAKERYLEALLLDVTEPTHAQIDTEGGNR